MRIGGGRCWLSWFSPGAALAAGLLFPAMARAVVPGEKCAPEVTGSTTFHFEEEPGTPIAAGFCSASGFRCARPEENGGPTYQLVDAGCDPNVGACQVQVRVPLRFPGNEDNIDDGSFRGMEVRWYFDSTASPCSDPVQCGQVSTCGKAFTGTATIDTDRATFTATRSLSCADIRSGTYPLSLTAWACISSSSCKKRLDVDGLDLDGEAVALEIGCTPPPLDFNCNEGDCQACFGGGLSGGGGAPGVGGPGGPANPAAGGGAFLYYAGGGAGHLGTPGASAWNTTLGRYWSHDYAQRIVLDPDETHVWLITEHGTFREYGNLAAGVYETLRPSDEYRILHRTGTGWELVAPDGTVIAFDANGRWESTTDRNGNARTASYDPLGVLASVSFPDGRREDFSYHPDRKLVGIEEVGVDGLTVRLWGYTWMGDDLVRVVRPDGTAIEYTYGDARYPGYLTRIERVGTAEGHRVEQAYEYDAHGNAVRSWRGAATFADAAAVGAWQLSFDDPAVPSEVTVTDPLGEVSVHTFDRDPAGSKPRLVSTSGDCPGCGLAANTQLVYGDAANPLRPSRTIDGNGTVTDFTYSAAGQVLTRTEAVGTPLERTTTWTYDASFPGLVATIERESVASEASSPRVRRDEWVRDAAGNPGTHRVEGSEGVEEVGGEMVPADFLYDTIMTFTAAGQPDTVDPPGYATADARSFTYHADRGGLLVATRTDPLIGTTSYGYDPFNRRASVTDPNGVVTTTEYDALDRVVRITQAGATAAEDRVTEHVYDQFGDLEKTVLPAGNEIAYGYDAAGRLVSVERRASAAAPGERTLWTLDGAGNRTVEALQRWDGSAWVTESSTGYVYSSRCHLARVDHPDGTSTEYGYDCNGNLSQVWDAAHPSAGRTVPPTQAYVYDALDRLVEMRQPWSGAGGGEVVTSYGYDVQDHLVSVTDGEGNVTTYAYSDRDLLTAEVSPASGTTTHAYNEHGELVQTVDGRGEVAARTVDALDRVSLMDYTGTDLDVAYAYDTAPSSCAASFPVGRLASITRNGASIDYCYDRFGQMLQDGALGYGYDANGNRATITYPGSVVATFGHDFADRPASLSVTTPAGTTDVVTAATWLPSGPIASLTRGNGTAEVRTYTSRYFPQTIELTAAQPLAWAYTTDAVGNITRVERCTGDLELTDGTITGAESHTSCGGIVAGPSLTVTGTGDLTLSAGQRVVLRSGFSVQAGGRFTANVDPALAAAEVRDYAYQDVQYYLTRADGPWGERDWSYDKIGNRLTELRDRSATPQQDHYAYVQNLAGTGNTPILDEIFLGVGGVRDYTWGSAGHLAQVASGGNQVDLATDAEGRMAAAARSDGVTTFAEAAFTYDGRSYLVAAADPAATTRVTPTYSSEGLLMALEEHTGATLDRRHLLLYFAGTPVAQWTDTAGTETWHHYTTDHLGTPIVAADATGSEIWRSSFDPWGKDPDQGTAVGALQNDVFLRLPGQWDSELWTDMVLGTQGVYYNVHRWYQPGLGRYTRPDPIGLSGGIHPYIYVVARPLNLIDPTGLRPPFITPEEIEDTGQRSCAQAALFRNYIELRQADWIGADAYFHCRANCEATQCGPVGEATACIISDLRELSDRLFKGDPKSAIEADQRANRLGRSLGRQNPTSCRVLCAHLRPKGLPSQY